MEEIEEKEQSAFFIECQQVLNEMRGSKETRKEAVELSREVMDILSRSKETHNTKYKDLEWMKKKKVQLPLPLTKQMIERQESSELQYKWSIPEKMDVVDDSIVRLQSSNCFIRIFITLPTSLLGRRDFVNGVYHVKRALMLSSAAIILRDELDGATVEFSSTTDDELYPCLRVTRDASCVEVCVGGSIDSIKSSRLLPTVGNIRASWCHGERAASKDEECSPMFNYRLGMDTHERHLLLSLQSFFTHRPKLQDVVCLLQRWTRIRRFKGVTDVLIRAWVMHLVLTKQLSDKFDTVSLLSTVFQSLASLPAGTSVSLSQDPSSVCQSSTSCLCVWDETGTVNIAYSLQYYDLVRLKNEANRALFCVGDLSRSFFLFHDQLSPIDIFDEFIHVQLPSSVLSNLELMADTVTYRDKKVSFYRQLTNQLKEAMGERMELCEIIDVEEMKESSEKRVWALSSSFPSPSTSSHIAFIIAIQPTQHWNNPLTIGPVANHPEAASFSSFWEKQCHIRKFVDGRMCLTMDWSDENGGEIPVKIVQFLVQRKWSTDPLLSSRSSLPSSLRSNPSNHQTISRSFTKLAEMLRGVTGLPLSITNVHAVSAYARGTELDDSVLVKGSGGAMTKGLLIPIPTSLPPFKPSIRVQIRLEHSGKWGENEKAIEYLHTAFLVQLSKSLKEQVSVESVVSEGNLLVYIDQIVFRLEIVNGKVHAMLRSELEKKKNEGSSRAEIVRTQKRLDEFERRFIREQVLSSSLSSLSSLHPSFSQSVQLFRRWLSSNLLSHLLSDYAIELLVAFVYSDKQRLAPPHSSLTAFRRVLHLLSTHNWTLRPLIVDLRGEWNDDRKSVIEKRFVELRAVLPPMVIVCEEDEKGTTWTRDTPDMILLKRLISLARCTHSLLVSHVSSPKPLDIEMLLSKEVGVWDVIISLDPSLIPRPPSSSHKTWHTTVPIVDWNPLRSFISLLNLNFSQVAYFFFNQYHPTKIAVKWKAVVEGSAVSLTRCGACKRGSDGKLHINRDEVMEGIRITGGPLVAQVTTVS